MSGDVDAYDESRAEMEAATAQGIDPIVAALRAAGIPVSIEQTGGFCMAAVTYTDFGAYVVTNDDGPSLGWYPNTGWENGELGETIPTPTIADVVHAIANGVTS